MATTRWVVHPALLTATRLHYPARSGRLLLRLDKWKYDNRLINWIIGRFLKIVGIWLECRDTGRDWKTAHFLTREEIEATWPINTPEMEPWERPVAGMPGAVRYGGIEYELADLADALADELMTSALAQLHDIKDRLERIRKVD